MLDLSILVTCYNKEPFLEECISSLLRQTKEPKEIIIVHDGCTEPQAHAAADTIILKNNLGVSRARHEAFRFSTGQLILFVDADDMLSPDYVEKMVLVLDSGADVVYPDLYFWPDTPRLRIPPKTIDGEYLFNLKKCPIPVSSLIKRDLYEKLGGFKDLPLLEDVDFWLRALCNGYSFKKAETLLWYRQTDNSRNSEELSKKKKLLYEIFNRYELIKGKLRAKNGT